MKRLSNRMIIAISILALVGVIFYFQEVRQANAKSPMSSVIIAKQYIPENTVITERMIYRESRSTQDLIKQKGDLTSMPEKIIGKRTRVPLYQNEAINLQRLMNNEPYMDANDNIKRTKLVIRIDDPDKALPFKKGSYIDIWLKPTVDGIAMGMKQSTKLFEKFKVDEVRTEVYTEAPTDTGNATASTKKQDVKEIVGTFLTLYLADEEIAKFLDVQDILQTKRITLHGENAEYVIMGEKILEKQTPALEENTGTNAEDATSVQTTNSTNE